MPILENLFEPILYTCYVTFYFFYYLFQGKQEWRHTDANRQGSAQRSGGTPECCDSVEEEPSNTFSQRSYSKTERSTSFAANRRPSSSPSFELIAHSGVIQRVKEFIAGWSPSWLTNLCSTVSSSLSSSLPAEGTGSRRILDFLWQPFLWAPWLCWRLLLFLLWMTFGILVIVGRIIVNIIHSDKPSEREEHAEHMTPREQSVDNVCVLENSEGSYPVDSAQSSKSSYGNVEVYPEEEDAHVEPAIPAEGSFDEHSGLLGIVRISTEAIPLSALASDVAAFASRNNTPEKWLEKDAEESLVNSNEANDDVDAGKHPDDNPPYVSFCSRRCSLPDAQTIPNGHGLQEVSHPPVEVNSKDYTRKASEAIRSQQTGEPPEYRQPLPENCHTPRLPNGHGFGKPTHALTESNSHNANEAFRLSRITDSAENRQPTTYDVHARMISSGGESQERNHAPRHYQNAGNTAADFRNANDTFRYQRTCDSPVYRQPKPHDVNVPAIQHSVISPKQRSSSAAPAAVVHQLPESSDNPDSPTRFVFYPRRRHSAIPDNIACSRTGYSASPQTVSPMSPTNDMSPPPSTSTRSPGVVLLGHSVFSPVREIEQIRDEFNRKAESRAASVARGEHHSRPPSAISQAYLRLTSRPAEASALQVHPSRLSRCATTGDHPAACSMAIDGEPEAIFGRRFTTADVVRTSRPKPWTENVASGLSTSSYGRVTSPQWVLKPDANATPDTFQSRTPLASSRTVLERKVTERCSAKDAHGRALNAWSDQEWLGRFKERDAGGRVTQHQSYENTFKNVESA